MDEENKINDAVSEINELISEGEIQNLSDDQLEKISELIDDIEKMLEE